MKKLETLHQEYNKYHARLAHLSNPINIAACNRILDRIVAEISKIIEEGK